MSSSKADDLERENFLNFAGHFQEDVKCGLTVFYDHVVNKLSVPYKIKNKEFSVFAADTPAFSLELQFHNVIIEDGRHPREILMTCVRGECINDHSATGKYRIRFINGLVTEGMIKESSFTFDELTVHLHLWNYNFSTYPFSVDTDKVPWRLIYEPAASLMQKWQMLGESGLNENEIENATTFQFLYTYLGLYLDSETYVGYGKSSVVYDKALIDRCVLSKRMRLAAKKLFETCHWKDMETLLENYEDNIRGFFEAWVLKITNKEGRILFDCVSEMIERCTRDYPRRKDLLPLYAGNRSFVRDILDTMFESRGYKGSYPVYVLKDKPKFIETSFVYERKYTYINEKQKVRMITFIESIVEGGLQISAVDGTMLVRDGSEKTFLNNALYCYFTDGGRRSARMKESLYITPEMSREDLREDIAAFFKQITAV